ncbi:hypothetical protein QUB30_22320 [Microcoleus sp. BROC3]
MKSKLPISNFQLLAIFVTDKAMVDVGFAGINPTYEQKRSALMAS